jgi:hypothetical protein
MFTLVEGSVRRVAERGQRIYLNFGNDWRWDFTIIVPPAMTRTSGADLARLRSLTGSRVRVRGWIERRNGPAIEISNLREIEVLSGMPMARTAGEQPLEMQSAPSP